MNNCTVLRCKLAVVAVTPDVVELTEVSAMVFSAVFVAPKTNRHARKRRLTDELAFAFGKGCTCLIPKFNRHTECATLNLPRVDRSCRTTANKTGNNVGAAGDRSEQYILVKIPINVLKALMRQR